MAASTYVGVAGVNRKLTQIPVGVGGVNRNCKAAWAGVSGVNRQVFSSLNCETIRKYTARIGPDCKGNSSCSVSSGSINISFSGIKQAEDREAGLGIGYIIDYEKDFSASSHNISIRVSNIVPSSMSKSHIGMNVRFLERTGTSGAYSVSDQASERISLASLNKVGNVYEYTFNFTLNVEEVTPRFVFYLNFTSDLTSSQTLSATIRSGDFLIDGVPMIPSDS